MSTYETLQALKEKKNKEKKIASETEEELPGHIKL